MNNTRILCVDDEPRVLHALQRDLMDEPLDVDVATSGSEGLEKLVTEEYAVVLSDHKMPGMSGTEFLEAAKETAPDTHRIMLTGYGDLKTVTAAVNLGGINAFLSKPWESEELKHAVLNGIERHQLVLQNRQLLDQLETRNAELKSLNLTLEQRVEERTRQLDKAYGELVHSEKLSAIGRMAAGIVHEVLNPLTVVVGRIHLLSSDRDLGENHRRHLTIAREQIDRAVQILDNLRDFSKPRKPSRSQVALNPLLTKTLELARPELKTRDIEAITNFGSLPLIGADPDQLGQVFLNLVNNAAEAMGEHGKLIVETRVSVEREGQVVEALFKDTGPGIAKEGLDRIFDPFFTTKDDGTGLGLSICRGIIEGHDGKLQAASVVGEGTTFTVRLPVSEGASASES